MYSKRLYETIMDAISREIRNAVNEYSILGVEVDSPIQQKISDINDYLPDNNIPFQYRDITKKVNDVFQNMYKKPEYLYFLKKWMPNANIKWSPKKVKTACTDGYDGMLIMNPDFMQQVYDATKDKTPNQLNTNLGVEFIVIHEAMHNYYNKERHAQEIKTPYDNIIIDKRINHEIEMKFPKLKGIAEIIGALL